MKNPTRALNIRQPFVELILQGKKKFEYRSTACNLRERVYIYAGLKDNPHAASWRKVKAKPSDLPRGGIVGTVEIVDCHWDKKEKCYSWKLRNPKRLTKVLKATNQPTPKFWLPKFKKT